MTFSIRTAVLLCGASALLSADTLTLRSGEAIRGTYLGGTARQVRMDLNGDVKTFDIGQVQSVTFSDPEVQPPPPPPPPQQSSSYPRDNSRDYPRETARDRDMPRAGLTIPVDTTITVRMIDSVNSEGARLGETFRASVDEPVFVNGQEVIPRNADVLTKLVADQQSGKIEGRTVLTLALSTININGRIVDVTTTDVQTSSGSRGARSAKVVGGTAALGAIIGAIAGGGKGAAIGAGSGAAVGTGAEVMTAGQKVKIPSETRLTFRLQSPIQL